MRSDSTIDLGFTQIPVTVIKGSKTAQFSSGSEVSGLPAPVRMLPEL